MKTKLYGKTSGVSGSCILYPEEVPPLWIFVVDSSGIFTHIRTFEHSVQHDCITQFHLQNKLRGNGSINWVQTPGGCSASLKPCAKSGALE
jgi:hypothetical protein